VKKLESGLRMSRHTKVIDGYLVPTKRDFKDIIPLLVGCEVQLECFEIPLSFIQVLPSPYYKYVSDSRFSVLVLGEEIGVSRIEFPTLDAMSNSGKIALVKLYRAKSLESKDEE